MPVTRKLLAQPNVQALRVDAVSRYIQNDSKNWQMLFGINSELTSSTQVLKLGAEFDKDSFEQIFLTAFLYNQSTGNVDNAATCTFKVYKVVNPNWTDNLVYTNSASLLPNQHFYLEVPLASLIGVDLDGGDTIMIEATVVRAETIFRDVLYVNHLGIYGSHISLKNKVQFLELTKADE